LIAALDIFPLQISPKRQQPKGNKILILNILYSIGLFSSREKFSTRLTA
jgi:hypothetical protein